VTSLIVDKLMYFGRKFSIWAGDCWCRNWKLSKPQIHYDPLSW